MESLITISGRKMMLNNYKVLALIPARGGSKGLPGKNIKPLLGKPLIAWTIEQAMASKYVDKVIVSTDDEEIAEVAKNYGAEVPFLRPKELAKDDSPTIDAILHALNFFSKKGEDFNLLALLEPTSPLRDTEDIDRCIRVLLDNEQAESIVSVCQLEGTHPEFNVIINDKGYIRKALDNTTNFNVIRRQDLKNIYFWFFDVQCGNIGF
jgi:CMP-N-acetylneuraminic acid synthetase